MSNDDVMLVDDDEAPLNTIASAATPPATSNLVISDSSDSEGFVERISITRRNKKNPRSTSYSMNSQSIPDNIYNTRSQQNRPNFEHARSFHGNNFNGSYARGNFFQHGSNRRFSGSAGDYGRKSSENG